MYLCTRKQTKNAHVQHQKNHSRHTPGHPPGPRRMRQRRRHHPQQLRPLCDYRGLHHRLNLLLGPTLHCLQLRLPLEGPLRQPRDALRHHHHRQRGERQHLRPGTAALQPLHRLPCRPMSVEGKPVGAEILLAAESHHHLTRLLWLRRHRVEKPRLLHLAGQRPGCCRCPARRQANHGRQGLLLGQPSVQPRLLAGWTDRHGRGAPGGRKVSRHRHHLHLRRCRCLRPPRDLPPVHLRHHRGRTQHCRQRDARLQPVQKPRHRTRGHVHRARTQPHRRLDSQQKLYPRGN